MNEVKKIQLNLAAMRAIKRGDLAELQKNIELGAVVGSAICETTFLHAAVANCQLEITAYLLSCGADVEFKDRQGFSVLQYAIFRVTDQDKREALVTLLRGHDANFSEALFEAAYMGNLEYLKQAEDLTKNDNGYTALHYAVAGGSLPYCQYLLEQVPQLLEMQQQKTQATAWLLAAGFGHIDIVKYLKETHKCEVGETLGLRGNALDAAVRGGHLNIVRYFVDECDVDISQQKEPSRSLLCTAASHGHLDIVCYLIEEKGYKIDERKWGDGSSHGYLTPLLFAVTQGHLHVVVYLIEARGCDIGQQSNYDETIIQLAVKSGQIKVLDYLLGLSGIDPHQKDRHGSSLLMLAVQQGNLPMIKFLKEKCGCNIYDVLQQREAVQMGTHTILQQAIHKGDLAIVKYFIDECDYNLRTRVASRNRALELAVFMAVKSGHIDILRYLVDEKGGKPKPYLIWAAHSGGLEVLQYLIEEQGCNARSKHKGRSLLQIVAASRELAMKTVGSNSEQKDMVRYLIEEHSLDAEERDRRGNTVLMLAIPQSVYKLSAIVSYLVEERRVDLTVKNNVDEDAVTIARESHGGMTVAKYLHEQLKARGFAVSDSVMWLIPRNKETLERLQNNDPSLKKVSLDGRDDFARQVCDDQGIGVLAEALKTNTHVKTLRLLCAFSAEGMRELVGALQINEILETLVLTINRQVRFSKEMEEILAAGLKSGMVLPCLELEISGFKEDGFQSDGLQSIFAALQSNQYMQTLSLHSHFIPAIKAFAAMLNINRVMQKLSLTLHEFELAQAKMLVSALENNTTLRSLELCIYGRGSVSAESIQTILTLLQKNKGLTAVSFTCDYINAASAKIIAQGLHVNSTLKSLSLNRSKIDAAGTGLIAEALKENTTLEKLDLSGNPVGEEGGKALFDALQQNTTLTSLSLSHYPVPISGELEELFIPRFGIVCMSKKSSEFWEAIEKGDVAKVNYLLNIGFDVNSVIEEEHGGGPLYYAIEFKQLAIVERLLAEPGIDVNWDGCSGYLGDEGDDDCYDAKVPFTAAVYNGNKEILYALLRAPKIDRSVFDEKNTWTTTVNYETSKTSAPIIRAIKRIKKYLDELSDDSPLSIVRDKCRETESIAFVMGGQLEHYVESSEVDPSACLLEVAKELEVKQLAEQASERRRTVAASLTLFVAADAEGGKESDESSEEAARLTR
jgi:ankyrin repeat protein/Ran GTPase-activating protein (RanGAP) involved in mRNA processing and transport